MDAILFRATFPALPRNHEESRNSAEAGGEGELRSFSSPATPAAATAGPRPGWGVGAGRPDAGDERAPRARPRAHSLSEPHRPSPPEDRGRPSRPPTPSRTRSGYLTRTF